MGATFVRRSVRCAKNARSTTSAVGPKKRRSWGRVVRANRPAPEELMRLASRDFAHAVEPRGLTAGNAPSGCLREAWPRRRVPHPTAIDLRASAVGQPLVHVHHKGDTEQRGCEIENRNRNKPRDEQPGRENGDLMPAPQSF